MSHLLSLRGIRKTYGERLVLDGIDLDVDEHRCVVLVGGAGAGKR